MKGILFNINYIIGLLFYNKYKNYSKASIFFKKALVFNKNHAKCNFKIGMCFFKIKNWKDAKDYFEVAIRLNNNILSWHEQLRQATNHLYNSSRIGKPIWVVVDELKNLADNNKDFKTNYDLGIALINMNKFSEALIYLDKAKEYVHKQKKDDVAQLFYKIGFCYEMLGDDFILLKQNNYSKAIENDDILNSKRFGIGCFHEKNFLWNYARSAYLDFYEISNKKDDELLYKLAISCEKLYEWEDAVLYFSKCLELNCHRPYTHYKLGSVYEKLSNYSLAYESYLEAIKRNSNFDSYYFYRIGIALTKLGRFENACHFFKYINILNMRPCSGTSSQNNSSYFKQKAIYTEFYESEEILKNTILYQSHTAKYVSCNPYAIFKYLLERADFNNYTHIWAIEDLKNIPNEYKQCKNVIFVITGSVLYLRYLASCEYLINSGSFFRFFIRKPGQKYLSTWHGTPWKFLGKDILKAFFPYFVTQKDFLQATHIISPNRHTSVILTERYEIKDIYSGLVYESGYPRIDLTLSNNESRKAYIRNLLNIDSSMKVVLYAPTYRGNFETANLEFSKLEQDMNILSRSGYHILYRGHYTIEDKNDTKITSVPRSIDTNELLSIVDVLITDYSSIAFDFMVLDRPIIYYVYDIASYKVEHGLYFDVKEFTKHPCKEIYDVLNILLDERLLLDCIPFKSVKEKYNIYDDGNSTERVVDMFFFDKIDDHRVYSLGERKVNLLFYNAMFARNGITSSFLNLINYIDLTKYSISIVIDVDLIKNNYTAQAYINSIRDKVNLIGNCNVLNQTLEEHWIINHHLFKKVRFNDRQEKLFANVYARDFRCIFGDAFFDAVISYEGYVESWANRFAYAKTKALKLIYCHSDMWSEFITKFPYLEQIFNVYRYFDKVISVSESLSSIQIKNFSKSYSIDISKFIFINNVIDYRKILFSQNFRLESKSDEEIFNTHKYVFITAGRFSIEKNHLTLIKAFEKLIKVNSDCALVILGDGVLKPSLLEYITSNNLTNKVFLLGYKQNPYSYFKRSSCFILSSIHEGQPIVLLESLVLGLPVIATNIPACTDLLKDKKAILVDTSEDALFEGMLNFIKNSTEYFKFDYVGYNSLVLSKFNSLFNVKTLNISNEKILSTPCIIMAKPDGFGMRLYSLIAGLVIAKKIQFSFYFKWVKMKDVIGNLHEMFNSNNHIPFALGKPEEIFDTSFLSNHLINNKDIQSNHGFAIHSKCKSFEEIKNGLYEQPWGWYAPSIGDGILYNWIQNYSVDECYRDLHEAYASIGFSHAYKEIIEDSFNVKKSLNSPFIAIHIRGADIVFSSTYKKASLFGYVGDKFFPYEIALDIIQKSLSEGKLIIIFSQDINASRILVDYFNNNKVILADTFAKKYKDITQRAFFEMNLMAKAEKIYTPGISLQKSAFSQFASCIAGKKLDISFHEIYSEEDQYEIIKSNLDLLDLDVMYKSMSCFRLFQLSIKLKYTFEVSLAHIDRAISYDETNISWYINKLYLYLLNNDKYRIENWLETNLNKYRNDFFETLFMFRGNIYKNFMDNIIKVKPLNMSFIAYLQVKIYLFRKNKILASKVYKKYLQDNSIFDDIRLFFVE